MWEPKSKSNLKITINEAFNTNIQWFCSVNLHHLTRCALPHFRRTCSLLKTWCSSKKSAQVFGACKRECTFCLVVVLRVHHQMHYHLMKIHQNWEQSYYLLKLSKIYMRASMAQLVKAHLLLGKSFKITDCHRFKSTLGKF